MIDTFNNSLDPIILFMINYLSCSKTLVCLLLSLIFRHCLTTTSQPLTVPLKLNNKVPYVHLSSFCSQGPTDSIGFQDAMVLLDSGSNQFWLADNQCSECPYTQSLCPQISESDQRINYYSGNIHGSYSFIKIC